MITYSKESAIRDTELARTREAMIKDNQAEHNKVVHEITEWSFDRLVTHYMDRISVLLLESANNGCDALIYDMPEDPRICKLIIEELHEAGYDVVKNITTFSLTPEFIEIRWDE